jgi:hypothetical protein
MCKKICYYFDLLLNTKEKEIIMAKMSIAQALIYKKRIAEALSEAQNEVRQYNCVEVVMTKEEEAAAAADISLLAKPDRQGVDVQEKFNFLKKLQSHMVDVKVSLWEASQPIRKLILELGEMKSSVQFLNGLQTSDGFGGSRYGTTSRFDSVIKREEKVSMIQELRRAIDEGQSQIDQFNHSTFVEIERLV